MRRVATAFLLTGATLLAIGCGGSADTEQATESSPTPAAEATVSADAVRVAMKDFKFAPENVEVKTGQTVTWVNEDTAQHDAVTSGDEGPKSELFNQGESYSWTAGKAGTIDYVCTVHPGMEGTITVR